jgi:hypothetical protein
MYNFCANIHSQNVLFKDSLTVAGRRPFIVNGGATANGIVFQNSQAVNMINSAESHRWWAQGILFDNMVLRGPSTLRINFGLYNRGDFGSGHGW